MKPILCTGSVVRNFLNSEVGAWPAKAIDSFKPFQWQDRRPIKDGTEHTELLEFNESIRAVRIRNRSGAIRVKYSPAWVGDVFYVRETCAETGCHETPWTYRTDWSPSEDQQERDFKWTPAIHAPKESSRIHLEVMRVRVERACDISADDAVAEGVMSYVSQQAGDHIVDAEQYLFRNLWERIYGKDAWGKWCWVYDLKRIK